MVYATYHILLQKDNAFNKKKLLFNGKSIMYLLLKLYVIGCNFTKIQKSWDFIFSFTLIKMAPSYIVIEMMKVKSAAKASNSNYF